MEFQRFAKSYSRYSLIQARVAEVLASKISGSFSHVVDLGCGSGGFFNAYKKPFVSYFAIDIAPEMIAIHPTINGVETMVGDFNDPKLFKVLKKREFDLIVSSSALQWSRDLDWTLSQIADFKKPVALSLFTSGTFKTLHSIAGISSPIRSKDETIRLLQKHLNVKIDTLQFRLYFSDRLSMLRYIKQSGVSGGRRKLSITQTRRILRDYPLLYLEFEVVIANNA
jgi:malonyl-CoA O-methyltransferase